jgi:hypothetical protein
MTKTYMKMKPQELHNKLSKRIAQPEALELRKTEILQAKKKQRSDKMTRLQHKKLWSRLISPLKYELSNAKVGAKHDGKNKPERDVAFSAYIKLMEKLVTKFETMQLLTDEETDKPMTPSTIAKDADIPNNGDHWTDWIPTSKRTQIAQLFEAIPHAPKTKRKVPFQRTKRPNTKQKNTLLVRTQKELGNAQTEQLIEPTEERAQLIAQMKRAITFIEQLKPSDAVPHTWYGLDQTRGQADPESI